jgi:hypothetical protein
MCHYDQSVWLARADLNVSGQTDSDVIRKLAEQELISENLNSLIS